MNSSLRKFFAPVALFGAMSAGVSAFAAVEATPESQGVSSEAILRWVNNLEKSFVGIHGFVIRRHGKVIAEGSWKPFDTLNEPHMLYSHSKVFTSTAIGFLVDDEKLDLDDRVAEILADKLPDNPSPELKSLRVRDLLSMTMGTPGHRLKGDCDWVKMALAKKFNSAPGTNFHYDSDATFLLAAIVERKVGRSMMDYLNERLFTPLGFGRVSTSTSPCGIPCGGWGMYMTTRDISKLGQLFLDEGMWGKERIISTEWVRLASAKQTKTTWDEADWRLGYGFQFWRCRHNAYRADGAYGQLTIVMPDQDAVVSMNAGLSNLGDQLSTVWNYLLKAMKDAPLKENPVALDKLRKRCDELRYSPIAGKRDGDSIVMGKTFKFNKNKRGFETISFERTADGWECSFKTRCGVQKFPIGFCEWKKSAIKVDPENFEGLGLCIGKQQVAASGAMTADGKFSIMVFFSNTPFRLTLNFAEKDGKVTAEGEFYGMNGCKLTAK